jgi:hypothetical protein
VTFALAQLIRVVAKPFLAQALILLAVVKPRFAFAKVIHAGT